MQIIGHCEKFRIFDDFFIIIVYRCLYLLIIFNVSRCLKNLFCAKSFSNAVKKYNLFKPQIFCICNYLDLFTLCFLFKSGSPIPILRKQRDFQLIV